MCGDELLSDATITIKGIDRKGLLKDVSMVISDQLDVNIHRLEISSDEGIFEGRIELKVHDRDELSEIIDALKVVPGLQNVVRAY